MRIRIILIAFFCLLTAHLSPLEAQSDDLFTFGSNISNAFRQQGKVFGGFDSRRSFVSRRDVKIFGGRFGIDWNNRVRIGAGLYGLSSPFYRQFQLSNDSGGTDTLQARLNFLYMTYFFEYVFYRAERWEISFPLHVGWGTSEYLGVPAQTNRPVILTEVMVTGYYKFFWFVGLGAGMGYRALLVKNDVVREDFNAMLYSLYVKVFLGDIYRRIFD